MSEGTPEQTQPETPPEGEQSPPSVDPITAPQPPDETPQEDESASGDAVQTQGGAVDAAVDPNLGHALEDQKQGVGVGLSQTTEQIEGGEDGQQLAESI